MDSYATDYYDLAYPGLIMKVGLSLFLYKAYILSPVAPEASSELPRGADLHPLHGVCGGRLALPVRAPRVGARPGRHGHDPPPHPHRHVQRGQ